MVAEGRRESAVFVLVQALRCLVARRGAHVLLRVPRSVARLGCCFSVALCLPFADAMVVGAHFLRGLACSASWAPRRGTAVYQSRRQIDQYVVPRWAPAAGTCRTGVAARQDLLDHATASAVGKVFRHRRSPVAGWLVVAGMDGRVVGGSTPACMDTGASVSVVVRLVAVVAAGTMGNNGGGASMAVGLRRRPTFAARQPPCRGRQRCRPCSRHRYLAMFGHDSCAELVQKRSA